MYIVWLKDAAGCHDSLWQPAVCDSRLNYMRVELFGIDYLSESS